MKTENTDTLRRALTKYIDSHSEDKNVPYLTAGEKTYSLSEIRDEIENGSEFGRRMEERIITLAIDLLARGKEKISEPEPQAEAESPEQKDDEIIGDDTEYAIIM
jgi:hypothetical protein